MRSSDDRSHVLGGLPVLQKCINRLGHNQNKTILVTRVNSHHHNANVYKYDTHMSCRSPHVGLPQGATHRVSWPGFRSNHPYLVALHEAWFPTV